jgi:predicted cobalt transporter CbtA
MIRTLVVRGLVAGLVAGLLAGAFGFAIGEPRIEDAIEIEQAASHSHAEVGADDAEAAPVSRSGQRGGLFLATALYGLAVGGLFALVFAAVRGRIGPRDDERLGVWLAALLFVAVVVVPFLKYPANPPAVGDPDTVGRRTGLYLALLACSLLALLAAARAARAVRSTAWWARPAAGAATFAGTAAIAIVALPDINEVPADFPADLLWDFRVASLGMQLVLWLALGVLFGLVRWGRAR